MDKPTGEIATEMTHTSRAEANFADLPNIESVHAFLADSVC